MRPHRGCLGRNPCLDQLSTSGAWHIQDIVMQLPDTSVADEQQNVPHKMEPSTPMLALSARLAHPPAPCTPFPTLQTPSTRGHHPLGLVHRPSHPHTAAFDWDTQGGICMLHGQVQRCRGAHCHSPLTHPLPRFSNPPTSCPPPSPPPRQHGRLLTHRRHGSQHQCTPTRPPATPHPRRHRLLQLCGRHGPQQQRPALCAAQRHRRRQAAPPRHQRAHGPDRLQGGAVHLPQGAAGVRGDGGAAGVGSCGR